MKRTLRPLGISLLAMWAASIAYATGVICTLTPGGSLIQVTEPCGQAMFATTDFLDWGQSASASGYSGLGEASNPPSAGPLHATSQSGVGVDLSSANMMLGRADNTLYAWSDVMGWTSPTIVAEQSNPNVVINVFGGHFGAPNAPGARPPFGDNLLGVFAPAGSEVGNATLNLNFNRTVAGVGFGVSSLSVSDFVATLKAFDSAGGLLATYVVDTNGMHVGGACAGLAKPADPTSPGDPIPCNDAPTIQIADASSRIRSVSLTVTDGQGAFINELMLAEASNGLVPTPEPAFGVATGLGFCGFALVAWRRRSRRA